MKIQNKSKGIKSVKLSITRAVLLTVIFSILTIFYFFPNNLQAATVTSTLNEDTFSANENSKWNSISWITELPYGKELPNNQSTESGNFVRGINMSGNVLLLHLNESTSSIVDYSGNSNNGTASGSIDYEVDGVFDKALKLNGNGFIQIPNNSNLNPTNQFSLFSWVKWDIDPATGENWSTIISKNLDNQYRLHHNRLNTRFEFAIRTTPNGNRWVESVTIPQRDKWYFIVGTYDGSVLRIYVNGVLENSNNHGGNISSSSADLFIGKRSSNDRYFNGTIDESGTFNKVLTAQEVFDMYQRGAGRLNMSVRSCAEELCTAGEVWQDLGVNNSSPYTLNVPSNRYFQYKFDGVSTDPAFTPVLHEVIVQYNNPPLSNSPLSPANTSTNISVNPNLFGGDYFDDEDDLHIATEWRVDNNNDFSSPVWTRVATSAETGTIVDTVNGNFDNELVGKNHLDYNTLYYFQVRYKDAGTDSWGEWFTSSFTTLEQYTINYFGNGNDAGLVPASQEKTYGVDIMISSNDGLLSTVGHTFTGWNTNPDGSGLQYQGGDIYSNNSAISLYAQWELINNDDRDNDPNSNGNSNNNNNNTQTCIYSVLSGDTLWYIAQVVFGNGNEASKIVDLNKEKYPEISNSLQVGWSLNIPCGQYNFGRSAIQGLTIANEDSSKNEIPDIDNNSSNASTINTSFDQNKEEVSKPKLYNIVITIIEKGKPLVGVKVELYSEPRLGMTNSKGVVEFDNVEAGNHTLKAEYNGRNIEKKITVDGSDENIDIEVNMSEADSNSWLWIVIIIIILAITVWFFYSKRNLKN
jgi:hypothetical protein